jgi:ATP-dependent 26S proteasome regulatory subunit
VLLNKLLNEMDGLREDAEILFILTTNRPDQIESALAARPGRIDQAIEFPLPDDDSRRQLARLYACGLEMCPEVLERIVHKTNGASAALIKELMRRGAQFLLERGDEHLELAHVDAALEEMLFQGGALNAKLLGGSAVSRPN